jgi:hypothetical protein
MERKSQQILSDWAMLMAATAPGATEGASEFAVSVSAEVYGAMKQVEMRLATYEGVCESLKIVKVPGDSPALMKMRLLDEEIDLVKEATRVMDRIADDERGLQLLL